MDVLSNSDIQNIVKQYNCESAHSWCLAKYSDKLLGYLGDHLRLIIKATDSAGQIEDIICFVKCIPRKDPEKANYLKESKFFDKEFVMLSDVLPKLENKEVTAQWYPRPLLLKENILVSEDVVVQGFKILEESQHDMSYEQIKTVVELIAKFNARCLIYEEKKSKNLGRQYSLWEDYSEYLKESEVGLAWRNAGKNAAIYFLKLHSKYRNNPKFSKNLENVMTELFSCGFEQMKPSTKYRNAICHRDLWKNNIFFKKQPDGKYSSLIIDFQTVVYSMPLMDLTSLFYFNTNKQFRNEHTLELLHFYYSVLSKELTLENINVLDIIDKPSLLAAYEEYTVFGITQAAIIVPIIAMKNETRMKYFDDPETGHIANMVCRNEIFTAVAEVDDGYKRKIIELLDEIVEKYVINLFD